MAWSELPSDLLVTIAGTLTEITDQIRFRCVCSRWRSAFRSLPLPPQLPWLILPSKPPSHFYSFSEDRIYPVRLSDDAGISCLVGSASGWLLALKGQRCNFTFSIINPFTGASVDVPSPDALSSLTYAPANSLVWDRSDSVVVIACMTEVPFYCHLGSQHSWKQIKYAQHVDARSIIFHKSKFYILNARTCEIIVLKEEGEMLEVIGVINCPDSEPNRFVTQHLIVSSEESSLFLVKSGRWLHGPEFFKVYQTDLKEELKEWREVTNIGDRAIFLDQLGCSLIEVDERSKWRRNCVYMAMSTIRLKKADRSTMWSKKADRLYIMYYVSVVDLGSREEGRVEGALTGFFVDNPCTQLTPTWIVPSLNRDIIRE
ncbi:hypothetical protein LUZ60_009166 [Juncus effusus]|nr:hypothetical protein LUZ60_009166 [Juncus effusus]